MARTIWVLSQLVEFLSMLCLYNIAPQLHPQARHMLWMIFTLTKCHDIAAKSSHPRFWQWKDTFWTNDPHCMYSDIYFGHFTWTAIWHWHIYILNLSLPFCLKYIPTLYLAVDCSFCITFFVAFALAFYLTFGLTFYLILSGIPRGILYSIWHFFWDSNLAHILTFDLTFHLAF